MRTLKTALGAVVAATVVAGGLSAVTVAAPVSDKQAPPAGPPMLQTTNRRLSPVVEARRQVADAKSEVGRYRQVINRKRQKLETALAGKPEYRAALVERNKAKGGYDAASRPALATARETDRYLKARAQWQSADAMVSAALGSGPAALTELASLRSDMRKCEAVVTARQGRGEADGAARRARGRGARGRRRVRRRGVAAQGGRGPARGRRGAARQGGAGFERRQGAGAAGLPRPAGGDPQGPDGRAELTAPHVGDRSVAHAVAEQRFQVRGLRAGEMTGLGGESEISGARP
jgi:hypothetical protein